MGVHQDKIIIGDQNGIEYVYPSSLLAEIFGCSEARVSELTIQNDRIELNELVKTKIELSKEILKRLDSNTPLPDELMTKLIHRVANAID